jgi:hypothetical protein
VMLLAVELVDAVERDDRERVEEVAPRPFRAQPRSSTGRW